MSLFNKLFKKESKSIRSAPSPAERATRYSAYPPPYMAPRRRVGFGWGKTAGILFAVLIPGGLVIAANRIVFPDASWLATGMVASTIGIAIIFAVASAFATPKVKRYVLIATFAIDVVLAGNLAFHWVLAREISGARQATTERHQEQDREDDRADKAAKRQKELLDAQAKALKAEAWRNAEARKLGIQAPRGARISAPSSTAPTAEATAAVVAAVDKPRTIEQVMNEYTPWLLGFAIAELLVSVVAFGICGLVWEWDLDGDGVDDAKQRQYPYPYTYPHTVPTWAPPYTTDRDGNVIWAQGYGPGGFGYQEATKPAEFRDESDAGKM